MVTLLDGTPVLPPLDLTIPEARDRLLALAARLARCEPDEIPAIAGELIQISKAMRRRYRGRKVPPRQLTPDQQMAREIRAYAHDHPDATEFEIGHHFNVNQGRVSEVLFGKRGPAPRAVAASDGMFE